jgi:hypothetical protein
MPMTEDERKIRRKQARDKWRLANPEKDKESTANKKYGGWLNKYQWGGGDFYPYDGGYRKPVTIKDTRKVNATSGKPINPNKDLKTGNYDSKIINDIIVASKYFNFDPATALAVGLQETNLGKTDENIGHVLDSVSMPYDIVYDNSQRATINARQREIVDPWVAQMVGVLDEKISQAKKNRIKEPAMQIQYYNGLGRVFPDTEKDYHGFSMQSIYGVPLPPQGISMKENPLYGKRILDLRDNVILSDPNLQKYIQRVNESYLPIQLAPDYYLEEYPDGGGVFNRSVNKKGNVKTSAEGYYAYINGVNLSNGGSPKTGWLNKYNKK